MLKAALDYASMGFSVIPVTEGDKKPKIKWQEHQTRKATVEEITEWWTKWPKANVGIVTGDISNLCVVDHDQYKPEYDEAVALEYFPDSLVTPCARSPRGGTHQYFTCPPGLVGNTGIVPGIDLRANGNFIVAPPSANGTGQPYEWILRICPKLGADNTKVYGEVPLQELPTIYINKLFLYIRGVVKSVVLDTTGANNYYKILQEGRRHSDIFKIGLAASDGGSSLETVSQVINILAKNANPPFSDKEIEIEIKGILDKIKAKERNLSEEVKEWCLLQEGCFNTSSIRHELHITTKREIKNLSVIINRLQYDGIIEKHGEKRGDYRVKQETGHLEMSFIEGSIPEFDIKLPFGLGGIVSLYPKNIIIIAGSKSAGKTALLMKIAMENQLSREVVYMNSEMGDEEWSVRLKNMGVRASGDIRMKALGVHKNFHDLMDGEKKIFIVDYLEIHDNFYEIAKPIRKIHEAIKEGICIIAVQKKQGEMLSRGGEFSMEKSRLYLSLDYLDDDRCTKITIADAKSPKSPEGVRGLFKRVKILNGCEFDVLDKDWRRI